MSKRTRPFDRRRSRRAKNAKRRSRRLIRKINCLVVRIAHAEAIVGKPNFWLPGPGDWSDALNGQALTGRPPA